MHDQDLPGKKESAITGGKLESGVGRMVWVKPSRAVALVFGFLVTCAPAAQAATLFEVSGGVPFIGGTQMSSPGYYDTVAFEDDYGDRYWLDVVEDPYSATLFQVALTFRFPVFQNDGFSLGLVNIDRIAPSSMFDFSMVICSYFGVYLSVPLFGSLSLVASGGLTSFGIIGVVGLLDQDLYYFGNHYDWGTLIKVVGTSGLYPSWSIGIRQDLAKDFYLDWTYLHAPGGTITHYSYLLGHSYLDGVGTEAPITLAGGSLIGVSLGKAF